MRKLFSFLTILFMAVLTSACINSFAVKELNEKAGQYMQEGDIKSAIARLESSVDLDDSIYETRYNLAIAYLKIDDCERALQNAQAAESLIKENEASNLYYTMGVAYNCLGENIYKNDCNDETETTCIMTEDVSKNVKMAQDYVNYLKKANASFEKYLQLNPDAKDADDVQSLISENKELILTKEQENGLN